MSDISKIKINDEVYNLKDAYARHVMNILLGIEPPDEQDEQPINKEDNEDK